MKIFSSFEVVNRKAVSGDMVVLRGVQSDVTLLVLLRH